MPESARRLLRRAAALTLALTLLLSGCAYYDALEREIKAAPEPPATQISSTETLTESGRAELSARGIELRSIA